MFKGLVFLWLKVGKIPKMSIFTYYYACLGFSYAANFQMSNEIKIHIIHNWLYILVTFNLIVFILVESVIT